MPKKSEIAFVAEQKGVTKTTIDKDWVLGHFVNAFFNLEIFKNILIFKGGTCLRKCYFQDYRFSEDLDFTAIDPGFNLTENSLKQLCDEVEKNASILLSIHSLKKLHFNQIKTSYQAEIKFWGADHSKNQRPLDPSRWQTKIKIEIILYEKMLYKPVLKEIIHPYSDKQKITAMAVCYDLAEVISEKLRAMIQRSYTAPRDYYDVWFLCNEYDFNWEQIREAFYNKMAFKQIDFEGLEQFIGKGQLQILQRHWQPSLGAHLPESKMPKLNVVINDLEILFKKIFD